MAAAEVSLYREILDAAVERVRADAGSIQLADGARQGLRLVAWRGVHPESAAFWKFVPAGSETTCDAALEAGERMVMPDVEALTQLGASGHLREYRRSRLRAVQSTPLLGPDGAVLGVLSTHWRTPHTPCAEELRLIDALARDLASASREFAAEPPVCAEAVSRQYATTLINRNIAARAEELDSVFRAITGERGTATFLCACGREDCQATLTVALAVYDRVRESPHRTLVLPEHHLAQISAIIEQAAGHAIVEIKPHYRHPAPSSSSHGVGS